MPPVSPSGWALRERAVAGRGGAGLPCCLSVVTRRPREAAVSRASSPLLARSCPERGTGRRGPTVRAMEGRRCHVPPGPCAGSARGPGLWAPSQPRGPRPRGGEPCSRPMGTRRGRITSPGGAGIGCGLSVGGSRERSGREGTAEASGRVPRGGGVKSRGEGGGDSAGRGIATCPPLRVPPTRVPWPGHPQDDLGGGSEWKSQAPSQSKLGDPPPKGAVINPPSLGSVPGRHRQTPPPRRKHSSVGETVATCPASWGAGTHMSLQHAAGGSLSACSPFSAVWLGVHGSPHTRLLGGSTPAGDSN